MTHFQAHDDRRMTILEQQVGSLRAQREYLTARILRLREFIATNCPHDALEEAPLERRVGPGAQED